MTPDDILYPLIAHKLGKPLDQISSSKTIKDLVGGKSTLQNEILGDLMAEFGNVLAEKSEELPLDRVVEVLSHSFSGTTGKTSNALINKLVSGKMPAGYGMSRVKEWLEKQHGLGPKRSQAVLTQGLAMQPTARFSSEDAAQAWLDQVVQSYAKRKSLVLRKPVAKGQDSQAVSLASSKDFQDLKSKLEEMMQSQMTIHSNYLNVNLHKQSQINELELQAKSMLLSSLDVWQREHGDVYADGIIPKFDAKKSRVFDSFWNWARQDALQLYYDIVFGNIRSVDRQLRNQAIHLMNRCDDVEAVIDFMKYYVDRSPQGEKYDRVRSLGQVLISHCENALSAEPVYKNCKFNFIYNSS